MNRLPKVLCFTRCLYSFCPFASKLALSPYVLINLSTSQSQECSGLGVFFLFKHDTFASRCHFLNIPSSENAPRPQCFSHFSFKKMSLFTSTFHPQLAGMLQKTATLPTFYSCDRKYAAKKLRENAMGFATFRTLFFATSLLFHNSLTCYLSAILTFLLCKWPCYCSYFGSFATRLPLIT